MVTQICPYIRSKGVKEIHVDLMEGQCTIYNVQVHSTAHIKKGSNTPAVQIDIASSFFKSITATVTGSASIQAELPRL